MWGSRRWGALRVASGPKSRAGNATFDVAAKVEIYNLMNRLTARGAAILMISSELPELLGMSDRILVMHRGRIQAEFERAAATEERVLSAALGLVS